MRRAPSVLASAAGIVTITLLLLEGALRLLTRSGTFGGFPLCPIDAAAPIHAARGVDFSKTYLVFDAELGWVVGASRRSQNGLYESTPSGARRVGPGPEPKPEDKVFALSFGDSFTHGDDVPAEGTWQHTLATTLGRTVVDFGVPGYGVDQALLRYRAIATRWPSEVVLIGLMADNIGRHVNRYRPFIVPEESVFFAKPRFELAGEELRLLEQPFRRLEDYFAPDLDAKLAELAHGDAWYEPGWYRRSLLDAWRTERVARTIAALREARAPRWRRLYADAAASALTRRIVVEFAAAVHADRRRAIVVFFPDRTFVEDVLSGREHLATSLLRDLGAAGIEVVDTTPVLVEFVRAGNALRDDFIPHYSARMNERVAALLAERLGGAR